MTRNPVDIIVFTPIATEFEAVFRLLPQKQDFKDAETGRNYLISTVAGKKGKYRVALRKTGSGHLNLFDEVSRAAVLFQPQVMLLTGTAGGLKKVTHGDIVIGDLGYSYESGRETDTGFAGRPRSLEASRTLVEAAELVAQKKKWKSSLSNQEKIKVLTGPIVSGEKVLASEDSYLVKRIRQHCDDAIALEMEAYAFLKAASNYPQIQTLNIRSISDLLGDKEQVNKKGSREIASHHAAVFTLELIKELELNKKTSYTSVYALAGFLMIALWIGKDQYDILPQPDQLVVDTTSANEGPLTQNKPKDATDSTIAYVPKPPPPKPVHREPEKDMTKENSFAEAEEEISERPETLIDTTAEEGIVESLEDSVKIDKELVILVDTINNIPDKPVRKFSNTIVFFNRRGSGNRILNEVAYIIDDQPKRAGIQKYQLQPGEHSFKFLYKSVYYEQHFTVSKYPNQRKVFYLEDFKE